jgi:hypothetical protein
MAKCDMCGNDYDKSFTIRKKGANTPSTASNARSTCWRRSVHIAIARIIGHGVETAARSIAARIARRESGARGVAIAPDVTIDSADLR